MTNDELIIKNAKLETVAQFKKWLPLFQVQLGHNSIFKLNKMLALMTPTQILEQIEQGGGNDK